MPLNKIDIVVVCHLRDLQMLRLQARSIARFVPPHIIGSILVIENDADSDAFAAAFDAVVLPEYGDMQGMVRLLRREDLVPGIAFAHGWRSQQVLKMVAAQVVTHDTMLVLDAKNHFIRHLDAHSYHAPDGRLVSYRISQRGHLQHMFRYSYAAFGLDPEPFMDQSLPNVTPLPVRPATIRAMIAALETEQRQSFPAFFLQNDVAEFYLLGAFIARRDGTYEREYRLGEPDVVTVFPDKAEAGAYQWVDLQVRRESTLCFGVHWAAVERLSPDLKATISATWMERGLVRDMAEGLSFLS